MLKVISAIALSVFLTASFSYKAEAYKPKQEAYVTINFNKNNIAYQAPLFKAVKHALKVKPNTIFEVVGYSARKNSLAANDVAQSIESFGVPSSQISLTHKHDISAPKPVVRIFVK